MVDLIIRSLADRFPIRVDTYQIMPNHVHLIMIIVGAIHESPVGKNHKCDKRADGDDQRAHDNGQWAHRDAPLQMGDHRSLLSQIIGFLKMNSTKIIHQISPNIQVWQRNYWDRIIRNEQEYFKIVNYIRTNPENWEKDKLFTGLVRPQ